MLDLAQLTLHFKIHILELGSLRQYHWKINVSTENFGCWQRVNWPWPDKSLREWACKLWTPSGKKWTILETKKNGIVDPTSFFKRQTKICDNKKLTSALPNLTSSSKQEQTKTKSARKKKLTSPLPRQTQAPWHAGPLFAPHSASCSTPSSQNMNHKMIIYRQIVPQS